MFRNIFYNREQEIAKLEEIWNEDRFRCVLIYGRRRIGKSYLMRYFAKDKNSIVVQFEKTKKNLDRFCEVVISHYHLPSIKVNSYKDLFEMISKIEKEKLLIILDEITYIFNEEDVLGEFQTIIDNLNYNNTNIMLILTGSYYSILKRKVMDRDAPLYGRFDEIIKLKGFSHETIKKYYAKSDEDAFILWAITGGVPKYLNILKNVKNIQQSIFNENSFLLYEGKQLLEEELRAVEVYNTILEAISRGHTTITEIANYVGILPKDTYKYIEVLIELGYIKKFYRRFNKSKRSSFYMITDNFIDFWFYFIRPYFEEISSGYSYKAYNNFKINFNKYLGKRFELFAYNYFSSQYGEVYLNVEIVKSNKEKEEIDIAIKDKNKIIFIETKWRNIPLNDAKRIISSLRDKT